MAELNTKHSRSGVLYASIIVVVVSVIGFAAAYHLRGDLMEQQEVHGDPSKRIGKGDGKSQNPIVIDKIDTPATSSGR